MKFEGNYNYFVNGESKTKEEVRDLIHSGMTVTIDNLRVNFISPRASKKEQFVRGWSEPHQTELLIGLAEKLKNSAKTNKEQLLEEVDKHQEQNGGRVKGVEFPFDNIMFCSKEQKQKSEGVGLNIMPNGMARGRVFTDPLQEIGKKESQTVKKAPVFTYCKQMKNAIEALALRSLYGHEKYEKRDDWENFSRVENGEFEYSNAQFRHALGIGEDSERDHRIAEAWNAVARLELYLRKNLEVKR